jgi:hypothetical protein
MNTNRRGRWPASPSEQAMALTNGASTAEPEASVTNGAPSEPQRGRKSIERLRRTKPRRGKEQSSISFAYKDLDTAVSVAQAMLQAGGVALTTEQLAGVMNLQPGSGNFVAKVSAARIFGLLSYSQGKHELTMLGFAIVDTDERRHRTAKAEAFLTVPLYRRTYEEFRGKQLPSKPGLEQAFVHFGVAPKQKTAARLAFEKSAQQAGFFINGDQDRLVEPITGTAASKVQVPAPDDRATGNHQPGSSTAPAGRHPFIQGLLDTLPEPGTNWAIEGRAKWLMAAAHNFDLIYMGSGEIQITAKPGPDKPTPAKE